MDENLAFMVSRLRKHFMGFCDESLRQLGLTNGLLYFLIYIGKHPGCTPGCLSQSLRADSGHTARSLEKLACLGYLRRERSSRDRRAFRLFLTPAGEAAFLRLRALFPRWDEEVCGKLTAGQREQLLSLLKLILSGIGEDAYV